MNAPSSDRAAPSETPLAAAPEAPPAPPAGPRRPGADIPYHLFLECVHCGLCTASCPTFVELGNENDSPRGRIYLMKSVVDGRLEPTPEVQRHLELCLDCRGCETACPSGVQYGKLIEPFRVSLEETGLGKKKSDDWFHQLILFGLFPRPDRLRWALWPARIAQRLGILKWMDDLGLWKYLPRKLAKLGKMLPPPAVDEGPLPPFLPAKGPKRARVALFTGCVADAVFRPTHWATARVLQANGCEVVVPQAQVCCGAIHFHAGCQQPARELARKNLEAFNAENVDAVVVNVAGCGAMLKEYGHHWHDADQAALEKFAGKVKDVHEFLDQLGLIAPTGEIPLAATYHDACHLKHAQKISDPPRKLLAKIPGLKLVELPESDLCCGAAGTYNLTEPEMADRLARRKVDNVEKTQANLLLAANAGCLLQIQRAAHEKKLPVWVGHPMDLLDLSYRKLKPEVPKT